MQPGPKVKPCFADADTRFRACSLLRPRAMELEKIVTREGTRCLTCGQGPNDIERDLLPEKTERVAWERKAKDAEGLRYLLGGSRCSIAA